MTTRPKDLDDWLTAREVAEMFKVQIATVRNWDRAGRLTAVRTPGGHRRFSRADVDALLTTEASA